MSDYLDYENFEELKKVPDEQYETYIKKLKDFWELLLRNLENTILTMRVLGKLGTL